MSATRSSLARSTTAVRDVGEGRAGPHDPDAHGRAAASAACAAATAAIATFAACAAGSTLATARSPGNPTGSTLATHTAGSTFAAIAAGAKLYERVSNLNSRLNQKDGDRSAAAEAAETFGAAAAAAATTAATRTQAGAGRRAARGGVNVRSARTTAAAARSDAARRRRRGKSGGPQHIHHGSEGLSATFARLTHRAHGTTGAADARSAPVVAPFATGHTSGPPWTTGRRAGARSGLTCTGAAVERTAARSACARRDRQDCALGRSAVSAVGRIALTPRYSARSVGPGAAARSLETGPRQYGNPKQLQVGVAVCDFQCDGSTRGPRAGAFALDNQLIKDGLLQLDVRRQNASVWCPASTNETLAEARLQSVGE